MSDCALSVCSCWHYVNVISAEADSSVDEGEQRVIATSADAEAGVEHRALLTDENRAGSHLLTAAALQAEKLRFAVTTVSR